MNKHLIHTFFFLAALSGAALADEAPTLEPKPLRDTLFSVSSDELDPADSLNRISGKIDLGFTNPSQSYESPGHYSPGPFSREKAIEG